MKTKRMDKTGRSSGVIAALIGLGVSVFVSLLGSALIAYLMGKGSVSENARGICAKVILFLSAFLGCMVCTSGVSEKILIYSGACALGYIVLLLLVNLVAFDSGISGLMWSVLIVASAALISGLLRSKRINGKGKRKFRFS